jgi:exosome complex RNA-binding protein Rrp42 (RNase PH superfamily)
LATRQLEIRFGQANGQAHLKLGRTHVLTQTSLKLVQPQGGKPNEGFYKFNIDFSSLLHGCEAAGMNVTLKEMKIDISQFIGKVLKSSRAIDRETLCII